MMFCWFYKFMISHTQDGDNRPSPITEKHILHCEDCHQFYKTCQSLGERLTREALIANSRISSRLNDHILEAIPNKRTQTKKVGRKLWIAAVAACLALIILTSASWLVIRPNAPNTVQPSPDKMTVAIQELRSVYWQVGRDLPITWPGVIEKPLANELENLTNDTQSAVRFLAACVTVDIVEIEDGKLN